MKTHARKRMLQKIYYCEAVDKDNDVYVERRTLPIDDLRKLIKTNDKEFMLSLGIMAAERKIFLDWNNSLVTITDGGLIELGNIDNSLSKSDLWKVIIEIIKLFLLVIKS